MPGSPFYPAVSTRLGTVLYVAFMLGMLGLLGWMVYELYTRGGTHSSFDVGVVLFVGVGFAHALWCRFHFKRFRQRLQAADFRLCGRCGSPVEGESGRCPACGAKFDVAKMRRAWGGWRGKVAEKVGVGPVAGR